MLTVISFNTTGSSAAPFAAGICWGRSVTPKRVKGNARAGSRHIKPVVSLFQHRAASEAAEYANAKCVNDLSSGEAAHPSKIVDVTSTMFNRRKVAVLVGSGMIMTQASDSSSAQNLDANGMLYLAQKKFVEGSVQESADLFDEAIHLKPGLKQYLWQRGLSLYYARRFEEGSEQFQTDVALNPNDTEESIWKFMCDVQTVGFSQARKQMLQVGKDSRPVMRAAYSLFKGDGSMDELLKAGERDGGSMFYALLYAGLYKEAQGEPEISKNFIQKAVNTTYTQRAGGRDYMVDLAKVHFALRSAKMDI